MGLPDTVTEKATGREQSPALALVTMFAGQEIVGGMTHI
jgi:hypothetical protein